MSERYFIILLDNATKIAIILVIFFFFFYDRIFEYFAIVFQLFQRYKNFYSISIKGQLKKQKDLSTCFELQ